MSDLKHLSVQQLMWSLSNCERYIGNLKSKLNGQQTRLTWIKHYLEHKSHNGRSPTTENTMLVNEDKYIKTTNADGTILFTPIPAPRPLKDWEPEPSNEVISGPTENYYSVSLRGTVTCHGEFNKGPMFNSGLIHNNFLTYPTRELAEKAAPQIRRNNAIVKACALVDPTFVADWDATVTQYSVYYSVANASWRTVCDALGSYGGCYVSTRATAEEVCAKLTEWGVK